MSDNTELEDFTALREEVEQARTKAEQAKGAMKQLLAQLKTDFDCDSLEAAEETLTNLRAKESKLRRQLATEITKYRATWTS